MHVATSALVLSPRMSGLEPYVQQLSGALLERPNAPRLSLYLTSEDHVNLAKEACAQDSELIYASRTVPVYDRKLA